VVSVETRREFFAGKLMDLANLAVLVLIFEQIAKDRTNWGIVLFGAAFFSVVFVICFYAKRRKTQ